MPTWRIIVEGKVQGVYFRASAKEEAERLKICGTVRNLPSGEVELLATADKPQLEALRDWCAKGPTHARVIRVFTEEIGFMHFLEFIIVR